ncbi:MAG: hypothetical protein ACI9TH_000847 [Kiritimatiellia bacterium]|jgi:hypothetical protein
MHVQQAKVDLIEFLHSGTFAGIALGMSGKEIEKILGEPETFGGLSANETVSSAMPKRRKFKDSTRTPTKDKALIWRYGDFEFHFARPANSLWMIFSDHFQGRPKGGSKLLVEDSFVCGQVRLMEMDPAFKTAGLSYEPVLVDSSNTTRIAFESGVQLEFLDTAEEGGPPAGLNGLSYSISEFL